MPVPRLEHGNSYRVEYEIDDGTESDINEERIAPVFNAARPSRENNVPEDVNLRGAINVLREKIAPIYAEIARIIINPHVEPGTVRNIMTKIRQMRNLLLTMEHLAIARDKYES